MTNPTSLTHLRILQCTTVLIALTFIQPTVNAQSWIQQGDDIDGASGVNLLGRAVSMSNDGLSIAVGAFDNGATLSGYVQIYKNILGTWTQQGENIVGQIAFEEFGSSVSLSADGLTVAIGAYSSDESAANAGQVRVYNLISGVWTQQGMDINGEAAEDQSGLSISLSNDGLTLAIGARFNDGNGEDAGHVRVYKFISGQWAQQGMDIDGEAEGDRSGSSVSLSADGSILAVGAPSNHGNNLFFSGHVRVYKFISGEWVLQGMEIDGEAGGDGSGAVSISADGLTLAIGARSNGGNGDFSGHARVYNFNSGEWIQQGADIDGEAEGDQSGAVSISDDGLTLAIGASRNDGNGDNSGHVRVYKFISGEWVQQGMDIDGEAQGDQSGAAIGLSGDGLTLAIGASNNGGNGAEAGHARVFGFIEDDEANVLNFDGLNDGISLTTNGLPIGNDPRTLEAVIRTTDEFGAIASFGGFGVNERFALYVSGGALYFVGEGNDYTSGAPVNDGQWHHIAATYDGTNLKLYLDGALVLTQVTAFNTASNQFSIGYKNTPGPLEYYQGDMEEVRIWNVERTQEELFANMSIELDLPQTGLVAYYKFNQGTAGGNNPTEIVLTDELDTNPGDLSNFALTGSFSNWVQGSEVVVFAEANVLNFDGVNDGISLTTDGLPTGNNPRTLEAVIRTTQEFAAIASFGGFGFNERFALYVSGGSLYFVGEGNDYSSGIPINDGEWHHIAASYDGENLKLYLDGTLVLTQTTAFNTASNQFSIGYKNTPNPVEWYLGDIDEVRVWDIERTQEELSANMSNELLLPQTGLVAYYKFNQGIAGGYNPTEIILNDELETNQGDLSNFALNGSFSNWVNGSVLCVPTTRVDLVAACDTYTWIDGSTYISDNDVATFTLPNAAGCDSVVTLNLSINNSSIGSDVISACDTYTWIDGNTYTTDNNEATFILVNEVGCDSSVTLNLTINTIDNTISEDGITLMANLEGASYQWLDCADNFAELPGETGQSFTATDNGSYAVEISQNDCSNMSSCFPITTVGTLENDFGDEFIVYPNPSDGAFSIDLGVYSGVAKVSISDLAGRQVSSQIYKTSELLNLRIEEPAGVYLMMIESGNKKAVLRFVKR